MSLAATYWNEFQSSDYYKAHEKEIPESMLGLACASVSKVNLSRLQVVANILYLTVL